MRVPSCGRSWVGGRSRRRDIIGHAVNQTFLLGRGAGIRISERLHRQLPVSDRAPWEKSQPTTVYVLGERRRRP